MNSYIKNIFAASAAVLMISLAACFGGGSNTSADTTGMVTQAEFDALKAQLRIQVVQLHPAASMSAARTMAFGGTPTAAPAAATVATTLGTSCGYDAPPPNTTTQCVIDSQGVSVNLPYPGGSSNDYAGLPEVLFDQPGCLGHAYAVQGVSLKSVPTTGANQFHIDPLNKGDLDTSTYFYLPANTQSVVFTAQSISTSNGDCRPLGPSSGSGIPLSPGVTGTWPAGPVGPSGLGTP